MRMDFELRQVIWNRDMIQLKSNLKFGGPKIIVTWFEHQRNVTNENETRSTHQNNYRSMVIKHHRKSETCRNLLSVNYQVKKLKELFSNLYLIKHFLHEFPRLTEPLWEQAVRVDLEELPVRVAVWQLDTDLLGERFTETRLAWGVTHVTREG